VKVLHPSAAAAGCQPRFASVAPVTPRLEPSPVSIERVTLRYSNLYLLRQGTTVALVDAGSPSDVPAATEALAAAGLRPSDVRLVVLTHGHGDHAGMGRFFQRAGAKMVVGRGDELQTTVGRNDEMHSTGPFATLARPLLRIDYEPFTPDVIVEDVLDLASLGLRGAVVRRMAGHTRGSVVVVVGGEAFVGDQMLGGVWGGIFHADEPGEHYYQLDPARTHCNVQALLDAGIERFYLGHGGPVTRDRVLEWRRSWPETPCAVSFSLR